MQDAHPGPLMQQQAAEKIVLAYRPCKVEMYSISARMRLRTIDFWRQRSLLASALTWALICIERDGG
jgi:hypothetical protein